MVKRRSRLSMAKSYFKALSDPSYITEALENYASAQDFSGVMSVSLPGKKLHVVFDSELSHTLLNYEHKKCSVMAMQATVAKGLPTFVTAAIDREKWAAHRRSYLPLFAKQDGLKINKTEAIAAAATHLITWHDKTGISVGYEAGQLALKYLAAALFDVKLTDEQARIIDQESDNGIQNFQVYSGLTLSTLPDALMDRLSGYRSAKNRIAAIIDELKESAPASSHLRKISNDEAFELLFAGHSTVKATTYNALLLLAHNPEWQDLIRQETQQNGIPLTIQKPNKDGNIPAVTQATMETLRLFPSLPYLSRQMVCDATFNEQNFGKGDIVVIPIKAIHRSPALYDKPEEFAPDLHFSVPAMTNRPKGSFLPFGFGPNGCPGQGMAVQEVQILLSMICSQFNLQANDSIPKTRSKLTIIADRNTTIRIAPR